MNRKTFARIWYDAGLPSPKNLPKNDIEPEIYKVAACSDMHFGSKQQALTPFLSYIQEVLAQDIRTMVIPGDICEGLMPRQGHEQLRFLHSIDEIYNYIYNIFSEFADQLENIYVICLSDDTEVYTTKYGWKNYNELKLGDEILSYIDGKLIPNNISDIQILPYNGNMISFKSTTIDALTTPDHMSYITTGQYSKMSYIKSIDLLNKKNTIYFRGAGLFNKPDALISDEMIGICALIVTEGTYLKQDGIQIYQYEDSSAPIRELLNSSGLEWSEYNGHNDRERVFYIKANDARIIKSNYLPEKLDIKWFVDNLSLRQLEIFHHWLMFGDGHLNTGGHSGVLYTNNDKLADQYQLICIKIGYRAMKTKRIRDIFGYKDNISYEIAFAKQNYCSIHGNNIHEVPYNGIVFDITTKLGNFLARRNGKPFFTGNCGNHDESLNRRAHGFNLCSNLARDFASIQYDDDPAKIINPVTLDGGIKAILYHGRGGCSKNLVSRSRNKLIDYMNYTKDIDLLFLGHCHRFSSDYWLGTHCFSLGCFQSTTHFLADMGKIPQVRGEIIQYKIDTKGTMRSVIDIPYCYDDQIKRNDF